MIGNSEFTEIARKCKCAEPAPYSPQGICAPMMPFGNCVKCGGEIKEEAWKTELRDRVKASFDKEIASKGPDFIWSQ